MGAKEIMEIIPHRQPFMLLDTIEELEIYRSELLDKKESITIKTIEAGIKDNSLSEMLKNEHGKSDYHKISDIELCTLIDNKIPAGSSIYTLDYSEKERIYQQLTEMRKFDSKQIQRCLNMRSIHDINKNRERHMSHTAKQ